MAWQQMAESGLQKTLVVQEAVVDQNSNPSFVPKFLTLQYLMLQEN